VKTKSIERLFLHILIYTYLLIPIFFFFLKIKKKEGLIFGLYGLVFFALLLLATYGILRTSYLYITIYTFLEYCFFTGMLLNSISIKKLRLIIFICSIFFISLQVIFYLTSRPGMDSIPVGIETVLIFIYIIFFFYQNFRNNYDQFIYDHHGFWLSIGMMIYLGGTFFFNLLANYIDPRDIDKYWFLTHIADIIKNLFFCIALIVYSRTHLQEKLFHHSSVPYLDLDMN
jgi:hypothetical protein